MFYTVIWTLQGDFIFCVLHARKRLRNILKIQFFQKVRNTPFLLIKVKIFLSIVFTVRNKLLCEHNEIITRHTRRKEDDIFFCLPLIADAMGNKANEKDRIGWHYLRDMFYKWLAGEANDVPQNNPNPFWVDIDWVLSYEKAEEQWNDAIETLILNENAIKQIKKYLHELGYIAEKRTEFDFINIPFSEWDKHHYQHISINFYDWNLIVEAFTQFTGLFVALGSFTFKFLAKGKIEYFENNFSVKVEQIAGFVHDTFNFESSENPFKDILGYWNCADKQMNIYEVIDGELMTNGRFRELREYNKIGNDFTVLSNQKIIDVFAII